MLRRLYARLSDPYDFAHAFRELRLAPDELPSLTRDHRLAGLGR